MEEDENAEPIVLVSPTFGLTKIILSLIPDVSSHLVVVDIDAYVAVDHHTMTLGISPITLLHLLSQTT